MAKTPQRLKPASLPERLKAQTQKRDAVQEREEARLIRLAKQAGYFDKRVLSADLLAQLKTFLAAQPPKQSQLKALKDEVSTMTKRLSEEERREDARRKILLGAFLVAQFEHKPALLASMRGELDKFLDQHKNKAMAAANKALLRDYLEEPRESEAETTTAAAAALAGIVKPGETA